MPRHAGQIELDRLLVKAAIAKKALNELLLTERAQELFTKIQKQITKDNKEADIKHINEVIKVLKKKLDTPEINAQIIENFKKEGAISQKVALNLIYPKDPQLLVPVIIKIIEDLLAVTKKSGDKQRETLRFIKMALRKVQDVDRTQNLGQFDQFEEIKKLSKESIRSDMMPLIERAQHLVFDEKNAMLWFEVIVWLEGHFLREHNKAANLAENQEKVEFVPVFGKPIVFSTKTKCGDVQLFFTNDKEIVAPIDDEDWSFFAGKGVPAWNGTHCTKHFVNSHFHALAVLLERKLKQELKLNFKTVDVFPTSIVEESPIKEQVFVEAKKVDPEKKSELSSAHVLSPLLSDAAKKFKSVSLTPDGIYNYETQEIDGVRILTTYIPIDCSAQSIKEGMRQLTDAIEKGNAPAPPPLPLLSELEKSVEEKIAAKDLFAHISMALEQCKLTGKEDHIIHAHMPEFEAFLSERYTQAYYSGSYKFRFVGERTHANEVKEMFASFKEDIVGNRKTTLEIVKALQSMWGKAKVKNSNSLLSAALEELIIDMRDKLIFHLPREPQLKY